MARIQTLKNPPIQEAVIDIRVVPPDARPATIFEAFTVQLKEDFPVVAKQEQVQATFMAAPNAMTEAKGNTIRTHTGYTLRDRENRNVCSVRRDQFAFAFVQHYEGWDALEQKALRYFEMYHSFWKPLSIERIGLRYINVFPVGREELVVRNYLPCAPQLPESAPQSLTSFNDVQEVVDKGSGIFGRIRQMATRTSAGRSLIVDIDVSKLISIDSPFLQVKTVLQSLREVKNNIFFGMVSDLALGPYQ